MRGRDGREARGAEEVPVHGAMAHRPGAVPCGVGLCGVGPAQERAVTLESLLGEMTDYGAVARWPDPPYTCRQASSYDRRSKTPADPGGWFANTDNMDGSGDSLRWQTIGSRRECVLMDVDGPGAVVRFWTGGQPPKGTVRFYLDGAQEPAIEAPLYDLLAGKSFVPRPLAIENAGMPATCTCPSRTRGTARLRTTRPSRVTRTPRRRGAGTTSNTARTRRARR